MSGDLELEAIERRIEAAQDEHSAHGRQKLQRLYIEREKAQERAFRKSLARRARLARGAK